MNPHQWYLKGLVSFKSVNTFIYGIAPQTNTAELLATKLGIPASRITNFTVNGADVQCAIAGTYEVKGFNFNDTSKVTRYIDTGGLVIGIGGQAFYSVPLVEGYFPNATYILGQAFDQNINSLNTLKMLYIPKVLTIGSTTGVETVFRMGNLTERKVYAHPSLATVNAGGVEGDLLSLTTGNTLRYVTNFVAPNPITNASVGNVYATAIQLIDNGASTNAIDYYENVKVNGIAYRNLKVGEHIIGLNPNTVNTIEAVAVDVFYNKSATAIITKSTIATIAYQDNLLSYYKMQNDAFDSWGVNNGTVTGTTYADGLVGKVAVINRAVNGRIIAGNSTTFNINNNASIVCIYNPTTYADSCVLEYGSFTSWGVIRQYTSGAMIFAYTSTSGAYVEFYADAPPLNTNTVIIYVRDFTNNQFKVYYNDVLKTTHTPTGTQSRQSTGNFIIGAGYRGSINGKVDEVAIFNKALTAIEVSQINTKLQLGQSLI